MNSISLNGKWQGEYTLGQEYESGEGISSEFLLDIIEKKGILKGTCTEPGISELFSNPITIKGFIEGVLISFIKQYPCLFFITEDNQYRIDTSQKHPDIEYQGEYDEETDSFHGTFTMISDATQYGYGWFEDVLSGSWRMHRVMNK
jgi:hypothetical protein